MKDFSVGVIIGFVLAIVVGCSTVLTSGTPAQRIYAIKSEYSIAVSAAVAYKSLPKCTAPGAPALCSSDVVVARLQQADSVAGPAIQSAENAIRDPNFNKSTADTVLAAAQAALNALTAITAQLPQKGK